MTNLEFDLLVFVGRFQPFHTEHKRIIDIALEKSKNVLVLVGSSGKARTIRNPFTFEERKEMISGAFGEAWASQLFIKPLRDKTYNDAAWIKQVQDVVLETALYVANDGNSFQANGYKDIKVGLIGASKDNTSYYLKMFPQFRSVNVTIETDLHATSIREDYFENGNVPKRKLPKNVFDFLLTQFTRTEAYTHLKNELEFVRDYKKQWAVSPYPPIFVTTDALVTCSGHILLVERKAEPGKGMLALPGGFLNQNEKIIDGTIRELREETKIKVPEPVLRGSIVRTVIFDDPHRSSRGRTITHCSLIQLPNAVELPKVKGSDDAKTAGWYKLGDLDESMLFEDHWHIIQYQLGL
jgi:bifunctional NMN adenylyltransferase/nudix hydrolase